MRTGQLPYTDLPGSALLPGSRASDHAPGRAFAKFLSGPWKIIRWRAETWAGDPPRRTENVIIVTLDGFRWQEVFGGADETLLDARSGGVRDVAGLKRRFWRPTAAQRRTALLPFFWNTVAKEGQVFGDPTK